jgi:hypothetical protein
MFSEGQKGDFISVGVDVARFVQEKSFLIEV